MGLELRMYGVAPFQLGPLHAGIQFQHAATKYGRLYNNDLHADWADNWMTSIVLNGGSTNTNPDRMGTVNKFYFDCINLGIHAAAFTEITMGDQVTCVTVIADERIWDFEKYPDLDMTMLKVVDPKNYLDPQFIPSISAENNRAIYDRWVENVVGGPKNLFLRETLRRMPLWR